MTAHWGVPDPVAATATPAEIALAFKDSYRTLNQRIGRWHNARSPKVSALPFCSRPWLAPGIMAAKLAGGNDALALLCNTLPTGAILTALILTFGPVSGAHFNRAVSIAFALRRELPWPEAAAYIAVQIAGGVIGVWAAHLMFELPVWQVSLHARTGTCQWLAEFVATFGLLLTISIGGASDPVNSSHDFERSAPIS